MKAHSISKNILKDIRYSKDMLKDIRYVNDRSFFNASNKPGGSLNYSKVEKDDIVSPASKEKPNYLHALKPYEISLETMLKNLKVNNLKLPFDRALDIIIAMAEVVRDYKAPEDSNLSNAKTPEEEFYAAYKAASSPRIKRKQAQLDNSEEEETDPINVSRGHGGISLNAFKINQSSLTLSEPTQTKSVHYSMENKESTHHLDEYNNSANQEKDDNAIKDVIALGYCIGELLGLIKDNQLSSIKRIEAKFSTRKKLCQCLTEFQKRLAYMANEEMTPKASFLYEEFKQLKECLSSNPVSHIAIIDGRFISKLNQKQKQFLLGCDEVVVQAPSDKRYQKSIKHLLSLGIKIKKIAVMPDINEDKIIATFNNITPHQPPKPVIHTYLTQQSLLRPKTILQLHEAGINLTPMAKAKVTDEQFNIAVKNLWDHEDKINASPSKMTSAKIEIIKKARLALHMHFKNNTLTQSTLIQILRAAQHQMYDQSTLKNRFSYTMFTQFGVRVLTNKEEKALHKLKKEMKKEFRQPSKPR